MHPELEWGEIAAATVAAPFEVAWQQRLRRLRERATGSF
jgi:hypothetical protein